MRNLLLWYVSLADILFRSKAGNAQEAVEFLKEVAKVITSTVHDAASDSESNLNAPRLKEVIKVGLQTARLAKTASGDSDAAGNNVWKVSKLHETARALQTSQRFAESQSIRSMWNQLLTVCGAKMPAEGAEASTGSGAAKESKKATKRSAPSSADTTAATMTTTTALKTKKQKQKHSG